MENELHQQPATPEEIWAMDRIARGIKRTEEIIGGSRRLTTSDEKTGGLILYQVGGTDGEPGGGRPGSLVKARGVRTVNTRMRGRRNGEHYEFDILAGNGEEMVVVEVKTTLRVEDVAQFLEKLGKFTDYEPDYRGKQIYGAVAYLRRRGLRIICRAAGLVRDPGHRQQRLHY